MKKYLNKMIFQKQQKMNKFNRHLSSRCNNNFIYLHLKAEKKVKLYTSRMKQLTQTYSKMFNKSFSKKEISMMLINIQKSKKIKICLNSKVKKVKKVKEKLLMIIMTKFMKILLISNNFRCNEKKMRQNNKNSCNNFMSQTKNNKNQISKNTLPNSMPNN